MPDEKKNSNSDNDSIKKASPVTSNNPIKRLMHMLGNKYRFDELLGQGGFAMVYKVTNLAVNRFEALKVLLDTQTAQPEFTERFSHEAQVSASLDHPHIIHVYEFGRQEGLFWFSMEYIKGSTLAKELGVRGKFSETEAVNLMLPLLEALEYSHGRGVIHRDIKPGNIMLDMTGKPYLMDFGIAKSMDSLLQTQTGQYLGTPVYMAPEQFSGRSMDNRTDLYAMGVTLYELLTGKFPFPADSPVQSLVSRLTVDPVPLSVVAPSVDERLEIIIQRALEREPENRFASAREMYEELSRLLGPDHVAEPLEIRSRPAIVGQDSSTVAFEMPEEHDNVTIIRGHQNHGLSEVTQKLTPGEALSVSSQPTEIDEHHRKKHQVVGAFALLVLIVMVTGLFLMKKEKKTDISDLKPDQPNIDQPTIKIKKPDMQKTDNKKPVTVIEKPAAEKTTRKPTEKPRENPGTVKPVIKKAVAVKKTIPPPSRPVTPPQLEKEVQPVFTSSLDAACQGRYINFSLLIGKEGNVLTARMISGNHPPQCNEVLTAVKAAVMKYSFKPALDAEQQPTQSRIAIAVQIKEPK